MAFGAYATIKIVKRTHPIFAVVAKVLLLILSWFEMFTLYVIEELAPSPVFRLVVLLATAQYQMPINRLGMPIV